MSQLTVDQRTFTEESEPDPDRECCEDARIITAEEWRKMGKKEKVARQHILDCYTLKPEQEE